MKFYEDILFRMNKPYICRNFFHTDWRHKRLKNTIDLLLFYGEHFYGFSESVLSDGIEKLTVIEPDSD